MTKRKKAAALAALLALLATGGFLIAPRGGSGAGDSPQGGETAGKEAASAEGQLRDPAEDAALLAPAKAGDRLPKSEELSNHSDFDLFNDALEGNRSLLSWAGLKPDQYEKFDDIIAATWKEMSADLEKNAVLLSEEAGDPNPHVPGNKNLKVYELKGSAERAEQRLERLRESLATEFGEPAAKRLLPYISRESYMAAFGRYSIHIKFYREDRLIREGLCLPTDMQDITVTDPETGKEMASSRGHVSKSIYHFIGTAFGKSEGP